jgi:GR25 family glycosyltransferase involved in LPS biosynthesis
MWVKRWLATLGGQDSIAAKAYRRLINIDFSHARVLSEGLTSGAPSILVLEDDASALTSNQVTDLARLIAFAQQSGVDFINLSESISAQELGVVQILNRGERLEQYSTCEVIRIDTPVTNTVCANLYSSEFASSFIQYLSPKRLLPVKPIDWRLNEFMMNNPQTACSWVRPGLFVQRSMHG